MFNTLRGALQHPTVLGTGVGALGGAGVGYLSSEKDDPNKLRNALAGGAMGAGIGGLAGALSHRGAQAEEEVATLVDKALQAGFSKGHTQGLYDVASNPELATKVLGEMDPASLKKVVKFFDKGWLTRMFGG